MICYDICASWLGDLQDKVPDIINYGQSYHLIYIKDSWDIIKEKNMPIDIKMQCEKGACDTIKRDLYS